MMNNEITIFIFRRDYRIHDNLSLNLSHGNILPIFIGTPEQLTDKNKYKSQNAIQFMMSSLKDLDDELASKGGKLHFFFGENVKVIKQIVNNLRKKEKKKSIKIAFNKDYTKYSIKRDKEIQQYCNDNNIECIIEEDYLLSPHGMGSFNTNSGEGNAYKVFTPFKNNALKILKNYLDKKIKLKKNYKSKTKTFLKIKFDFEKDLNFFSKFFNINKNIFVNGGRKEALKIIGNIRHSKFSNYNKCNNILSYNTTHLSAYIKFGCVSIREVYNECVSVGGSGSDGIISQLLWREFYYYVSYYYPNGIRENYGNKIKWNNDTKLINKWKNGETGYNVVDAGMKELNNTGFMHNRARLITSNFLNRLIGADWRIGEKYFAQKLIDYDPNVNNGNWQWVASVGVDTKPFYQRIFNPYTQEKKYDIDGKYVEKWIEDDDRKEIIEYKKARERSIKMYEKGL